MGSRTGSPAGLPGGGDPDLNHLLGIYVNDQWTRDRLTLNLGVRFDYKSASVVSVTQPAGRFLPERIYPAVEDAPNWKDLSPRLGAAYDLFGDGQTALKFGWSRYVGGGNYIGEANFLNPASAASTSANREWTDLNGNFTPECDFLGPRQTANVGRSKTSISGSSATYLEATTPMPWRAGTYGPTTPKWWWPSSSN